MQRDTNGVQCTSSDCLMATPPAFYVEKGKTEVKEHRNNFGTVCMHLWADRQRHASHVVVERRYEKGLYINTLLHVCLYRCGLNLIKGCIAHTSSPPCISE